MEDQMTDDIERQKEERRREIRAKIRALRAKIDSLNNYKSQLEEKYASTDNDVLIPESTYDLTVSSDIMHWAGKLEESGEEYQGNTESGIKCFMSGIMEVIGVINRLIERFEDEISEMEDELASI